LQDDSVFFCVLAESYETINQPIRSINKPPLHVAHIVTFVEQPSSHSLDTCEDKWYRKLDAQIIIQSMILSCL